MEKPTATIKSEEEPFLQNKSASGTNPLVRSPRYPHGRPDSIHPLSNPTNPNTAISSEANLPPRFHWILDRIKLEYPGLAEKRYNDFVLAEDNYLQTNEPLSEGNGNIKLYVNIFLFRGS